jgi:hypothetical protein
LPAEVFQAVRAVEGKATESPGWLTLTLALEWAAAHPEPPPARSGPDWLQEFFGHLTSRTDRPGEPVPVTGWVAADDLRPFLTALGSVVGYDVTEDEWAAIAAEVGESDSEAGYWSEQEFAGGHRVKVQLARDPRGRGVQLRLEVPREVEPQVRQAFATFQHSSPRERPA